MTEIKDEEGNLWHNSEARMKRLNTGVKGAHACIPFQCETCWMRNLEGRDISKGDEAYVMCLRRANLDAMAGKAKKTILSHKDEVIRTVKNCKAIRKTPSYAPRGPFPLADSCGMGLVVEMLVKSYTAVGRITEFVQFETIRRLRSTYTKVFESSPAGASEGSSFARGTGRVRPTSCPSQSEWMQDVLRGMEYRMGYDTQADHAVPMEAMVTLLDYIKRDAEECKDPSEANELWKIGAFICMVTSASLRGYEGFYTDLAGLRSNLDKGRKGVIPPGLTHESIVEENEVVNLPHVAICLLGNFKGEGGVNYHTINVANNSLSGLQTRWWVEKLVNVANQEGRSRGPAFAYADGSLAVGSEYDAVFRKYLRQVQDTTNWIAGDVNVDVFFSLSRTPRKTALTRARRANLGKKHVDSMNRWRTVENAQGKRPRFNMRQHYSEACLLMPVTWFYSYAL